MAVVTPGAASGAGVWFAKITRMSIAGTIEKTIRRSGSTIHYWLAGPEDGRLVTFTPGASMDRRMFDEQVSAVASAGYRVLTWDVRGHGRSKPIGDGFSLGIVAGDLLALMDEAGYRKAVHVGQSFGGFVAQEIARHHPERVRALALVGSTSVTMHYRRRDRWALKLTPPLFKLWPEEDFKKRVAQNTATKPGVQRYAYDATNALSKEEFLQVWKGVVRSLDEDEGYRIRQPLLLTHGEHDRVGNVAKVAAEWAAREPDCRYEVIPDAGHNANQDNPAFFNRMLSDFLGQRAPARSG